MKGFWFLIKLSALILVAGWVIRQDGSVIITWLDYEIETSVGLVILGIAAIALMYSSFDNLLRVLRTSVKSIFKTPTEKTLQKGIDAVTDGYIALAQGDARTATAQSKKAGKLLEEAPITHLLAAQAAQMRQDPATAKQHYQELLLDDRTQQLGLKGLLRQSLQKQEYDSALAIVEEAHQRNPKSKWALVNKFHLLAREGRHDQAHEILTKAYKADGFDRDDYKMHQAALFYAASQSDVENRENLLKAAVNAAPWFAPTAAAYALEICHSQLRKAKGVLQKAWNASPHPLLIEAALQLQLETKKRMHLFEKFADAYPDHYLSELGLGKAAIKGNFVGLARTHLEKSFSNKALHSTYDILQKLNEAAPKKTFVSEPMWVCEETGHRTADWAPQNPLAFGFDTYRWEQPSQLVQTTALPSLAEVA